MDRLCYSCIPTTIVDDARAKACPREHCAARSDLEREKKPQGTREPQRNPGESYTFVIPSSVTSVTIGKVTGSGGGGGGETIASGGAGGAPYYDDGGGI